MAYTSQPAAFAPNNFQTELTNCCDDMSICCLGFICPPILGCMIASDMNECCLCGSAWPMRSVYRTKYNIPGSMLDDYCVSMFCGPCATCQLRRDIKIRKSTGQF
ncbi:placenta-specific gene 8 protein-like [Garra rufa]|uniref:placenta-specific gene 8 protein-like n=1 Tax=Garra rufa TaxID=137080 RepID=UPI003CCE5845